MSVTVIQWINVCIILSMMIVLYILNHKYMDKNEIYNSSDKFITSTMSALISVIFSSVVMFKCNFDVFYDIRLWVIFFFTSYGFSFLSYPIVEFICMSLVLSKKKKISKH